MSSALFLFGLSLIYGMTGTTSFDGNPNGALHGRARRAWRTTWPAPRRSCCCMVGFGFKVAAVPFHQWAPDAYEGAPAPVAAWIATGSKLASFVAIMKVFLHALLPWSSPTTSIMGPGWIGIVAVISAVTMTYGNFAALAQQEPQADAGLLVDRPRRLHPGRRGGRQRLDEGTERGRGGALLPDRLCVRQRRRIRRRPPGWCATRTATTSTT